ncbi:hypothetical protein K474DRAFT_1669808 [Panus rudis PR-1116 ss-1]|nr:hypothetical protein K474DRAFT_1669808 [Panus rudis PR-1116 ss-1]
MAEHGISHYGVAILAALATHMGLSIPGVDHTLWEAVTVKGLEVESSVKESLYTTLVIRLTKILVGSCTAYELLSGYVKSNPFSQASRLILEWLPGDLLLSDKYDSLHSSLSRTRAAGLALLLVGALLQLSARVSLGKYAYFPLIPATPAPRRMLYVPASQLPVIPDAQNSSGEKGFIWSLRATHELVTSGPYEVIRHPMYTGAILTLFGSGLYYLSSGSTLRSFLIQHLRGTPLLALPSHWTPTVIGEKAKGLTWTGLLLGVVLLAAIGVVRDLVTRARREDAALEEHFQKRWAYYQWRVRYSFMPGLF